MEIKYRFHNINEIKNNAYKLEELANWGEENNLAVIGVIETNISEKGGKHIGKSSSEYNSFWANSEEEKKKGSGVGFWLARSGRHIWQE